MNKKWTFKFELKENLRINQLFQLPIDSENLKLKSMFQKVSVLLTVIFFLLDILIGVKFTLSQRAQKGKVGITLNADWIEPLDDANESDRKATKRALDFSIGW